MAIELTDRMRTLLDQRAKLAERRARGANVDAEWRRLFEEIKAEEPRCLTGRSGPGTDHGDSPTFDGFGIEPGAGDVGDR